MVYTYSLHSYIKNKIIKHFMLGTYTLSNLLSSREQIAKTVLQTFKRACDPWGITVERVEVS